ncbi:MAG: hypothetical protein Q9174_005473 [Haloplaca sp. 1 TL-2023]
MTFTDAVVNQPTNSASLAYALQTFDLIGSGQTRSDSLSSVGMVDKAAAFWWREVDLWQGAVQFFHDAPERGNFVTLFLSEWPRDVPNSMSEWWMNNQVSAVNWKALTDRQRMTLYQYEDGSGITFDNIKGWGSFKEIARLGDYGFNNRTSSFSWTSVSPKKEIIEPITLPANADAGSTSFTAFNSGYNRSDKEQPGEVKLKVEESQSVSVETSDTHHVGMSVKVSQTVKAGVESVASSETTVEVGFSYDYTNTQTVTRSSSKTIAVDITQGFVAPPWTHFRATVVASVSSCPPAEYHTTATRWYDYAIPNGVRDPANSNWYKRQEMVTFRIGGNLMSSHRWWIETTDLGTPVKPAPT